MKRKTVKLDNKSLRSLIREAIQGRQPGSPLFTPPRSNRIKEAGWDQRRYQAETMTSDEAVLGLVDQVREMFGAMYDESDPSMEAAGGQEAWDEQVEKAVSELESKAVSLVDEIQAKLLDGEYSGH